MQTLNNKPSMWYWIPVLALILLELVAEVVRWDQPVFHAVVKGSVLPALIIVYGLQTRGSSSKARIPFMIGLFASWLGDLFLLREEDAFFTLGLSAFLIAHLAYAWSFSKAQQDTIQIPLAKKYPLFVIGAFAFGVVMFTLFYNNLHGLLIPVIFYIAAILVMALTAISRYGRTNRKSFQWVLAGALLFLISDSILGFNKFTQPLPWANIWIMLTYMAAQASLVQGMIWYEKGMD